MLSFQVLRDQGLGKYCDPAFVRATSREMQEAMEMTEREFDEAAHRLLQAEQKGHIRLDKGNKAGGGKVARFEDDYADEDEEEEEMMLADETAPLQRRRQPPERFSDGAGAVPEPARPSRVRRGQQQPQQQQQQSLPRPERSPHRRR